MKNSCDIFEIIVLYVFSAYYVVKEFFDHVFASNTNLTGELFMKCEGKTAIITGGTTGIGLETTRKLLNFGLNIIIGSNSSAQESKECVEILRQQFPKCKVEIWYVDLLSLDSVKEFADRYLESGLPLHFLINNAGIMFAPYQLSKDGYESHFSVNYLSHCLLTIRLLQRLQESGSAKCQSRIVNVASCLHYLSKPDLQDFHNLKSYCCHQSYMQSKLFQIMFTISMNHFLRKGKSPVTVNAVHPGVIYTGLYKHVWCSKIISLFLWKKPSNGADTSVFTLLSAKLEGIGGKYIEDFRIVQPVEFSKNEENLNRLWNQTWQLLNPWLDTTVSNNTA